jgi:DNA-binding NarL/FixJ family response regulator
LALGVAERSKSVKMPTTTPVVAVLLLSAYDPEEFATRMASSGAFAFISKGAFGPDRLGEAWTRARSS